MNSLETWRGQVPAWQCDAAGRWDPRFVYGAFEEATRVFSAFAGIECKTLIFDGAASQRPTAGSTLVIVTEWQADATSISHRLTTGTDEPAIWCYASLPSAPSPAAPLPAPAAEAGSIAAVLGIVGPWECDIMGHMSVQFYAGRLAEAEAAVGARLGLDPGAPSGPALRPTEHRLRFFAELATGDILCARSAVRPQGPERLFCRTELRSAPSGKLAAAFESDLACIDAATGTAKPMPETILQGAARLPFTEGDHAVVWTSKGELGLDCIDTGGWIVLRREEVVAWEVDHHGLMPPRFFFARMSSSVPYMMERIGLGRDLMQGERLGRAAVGYRLRYHRWPRVGDCIELRSSIGAVGEKSWRFRHAFVDVSDGTIVCSVESIVVLFSLTERRAVALPPSVRQSAQRLADCFVTPSAGDSP